MQTNTHHQKSVGGFHAEQAPNDAFSAAEKRAGLSTRPYRIAMVVASPFPANHGTPGSIRELVEALSARGHHVHVVTYHFGADLPVKSCHIHRIPDLGLSRDIVVGPTKTKPLLDLMMVSTLCQVIRNEGIEVIHAHNYEGALVGYLARLLTGRPLVYHAINTMGDELPTYNFIKPRMLARGLAKFLDHVVPRTADRIITISDELVRFLRQRGVSSDRIHPIPLGIDTALMASGCGAAIRDQYGVPTNRLVMYTGILDRFQRVDYLLKAMRVVVDTLDDAHLLLVTNLAKDHDRQACQDMINDLGLQAHVDIVRHDSFEDVPNFLAAADVTVVSRPHCPGIPVKLLNALAAGKPCVMFAGSADGLQHMQQAFMAPDHDWHALGQGIIALLCDPRLAATLGRQGQQWVAEQRGWPCIIEQTEQVYHEVLKGRKGP